MAPITLGWLHVVALLGALQGLFLAAVLATQQRNRTANRILAVAMVAFSISLTTAVYHAGGFEQRFPHFFGAGYPLPLVFGPLIYLYAVTASDRSRGFRPRDWLHFLPIALVLLATLDVYLMSGAEKIAFYHRLQQGDVPPVLRIVEPLKFVSGISYATATILFLRRHRARVKESYSSIEQVNLQWLLELSMGAAAIWALATFIEITGGVDVPLLARGDDAIALAIAILVYWIGYRALRQPEILNFASVDTPPPAPTAGTDAPLAAVAPVPPAEAPAPAAVPSATSAARYERSGLTDREAALLERALRAVMETERLYQNANLTLADLADRLKTTPHKLSEVLNSQLNQTFYDFVNAYRVRDVQQRIADAKLKHLKILSLAMDAGFASKSTFNHVFRQHTGRTPSDYRRSLAS